jgi:hypothetical protein
MPTTLPPRTNPRGPLSGEEIFAAAASREAAAVAGFAIAGLILQLGAAVLVPLQPAVLALLG